MEATTKVFVTYHQMLVAEPGAEPPGSVRNGLTASVPGAAMIHTGVHTGFVEVTVRLAAEALDHVDGWEEEAEADLVTSTGEIYLMGVAEGASSTTLTPQGPGHYRMRVHARGRASGSGESYLIVVWPIELGADAVARYRPEPLPRSEIREWARERGLPFSERGRIAGGPGFHREGPAR
ncbi:Lsr2 family DNA-binding protein [Nonomuraea roseola]|uniref:Lsr2 DNA-binding domain-containing protein n=1 Tax=Nonomuraea roseola TaxID=46179 RepID=A0ABV5PR35_9ACTN